MLLLTLVLGCGDADSPAMNHPGMSGTEMPAQHAQAFDEMFIDMMVPHHQGAVAMAVIANDRAEHPEIKALAGRIITSQEAEIGRMKTWRKAWFGSDVTPAMDMPANHAQMPGMDHMSGMAGMAKDIEALKTAVPFDLAFLDAMIPHHESAVAMGEACAGKAQHAEIKALALTIIEDQRKEIAQMKEWRLAWYPSAPALSEAR